MLNGVMDGSNMMNYHFPDNFDKQQVNDHLVEAMFEQIGPLRIFPSFG